MNDIDDLNDLILNKSACDKDVDIGQIIEILPQWKTYILEAKMIDEENIRKLSLRFLLDAHSVEEIKEWIAQLEDSTKTTYSIYSTLKAAGKFVNFKQRLVCQHNTRHKNVYDPSTKSRKSTKNTNCPAKMTVVLHAIKRRYQGKDKETYALKRQMPCEVTFIPTHNHRSLSAHPLKYRKMGVEVKEKLLNLFRDGHTASTALESLKIDIQLNNENFEELLADRKYCPTYNDCYQLYKQREKYYIQEFNDDESPNESFHPKIETIDVLPNECLHPLKIETIDVLPNECLHPLNVETIMCRSHLIDNNIYEDKDPLEPHDSTTSACSPNLNDNIVYEDKEPHDSTTSACSPNLNDNIVFEDKDSLEPHDCTTSPILNDNNMLAVKDPSQQLVPTTTACSLNLNENNMIINTISLKQHDSTTSACSSNLNDNNMIVDRNSLELHDSTTSTCSPNSNDNNIIVDKGHLEPHDSTTSEYISNLNDTNMPSNNDLLQPVNSNSSNLNHNNMFIDKDLIQEPFVIGNMMESEIMNEEIISLEETAKTSAKVHLDNIYHVFREFIETSPMELAAGLKSMEETLKSIKNPTNLASYCMSFGPGIHRSPRKSKFLVKNNPLGRRPRRTINIPDITRIAEQNLAKALEFNLNNQPS